MPCSRIEIDMVCKLQLKVVLLLMWLLAPALCQAESFYRYLNEQGSVVVDFRIPPQYVKGGYEILNQDGMVIEVVPPEPDASQRNDRDNQRRRAANAKAEQERLLRWDESLLRRYSTLEDIEAARDRALRDLRIRVSILKSNRRSLRQKIENAQARVAEAERLRREPAAMDLDLIKETKTEIDALERAINDRQQQIASVSADFEEDMERFRQLQDVVVLRRSMESSYNR